MKKFLIFILLIITYFYISGLTEESTRIKADDIIKNIMLYKDETGKYPNSLDDLIPKYYKKIPIHYSSIDYKFHYYLLSKEKQDFLFYYTYYFPFGRFSYSEERKTWFNLD
ncbi:MAG: hypothetical protein PHE25_00700 [Candidatus Gracilibacteria bacterium]|nr:hypothetical protein [Candidatus Gracilibacteria bacterium]